MDFTKYNWLQQARLFRHLRELQVGRVSVTVICSEITQSVYLYTVCFQIDCSVHVNHYDAHCDSLHQCGSTPSRKLVQCTSFSDHCQWHCFVWEITGPRGTAPWCSEVRGTGISVHTPRVLVQDMYTDFGYLLKADDIWMSLHIHAYNIHRLSCNCSSWSKESGITRRYLVQPSNCSDPGSGFDRVRSRDNAD